MTFERPSGRDYAAGLLLLIVVLLDHSAIGCTPAKSAAEADYLAEQLACVDKAATKAEATACRNAVKADWAAADGGAP